MSDAFFEALILEWFNIPDDNSPGDLPHYTLFFFKFPLNPFSFFKLPQVLEVSDRIPRQCSKLRTLFFLIINTFIWECAHEKMVGCMVLSSL